MSNYSKAAEAYKDTLARMHEIWTTSDCEWEAEQVVRAFIEEHGEREWRCASLPTPVHGEVWGNIHKDCGWVFVVPVSAVEGNTE